MGLVKHISEDIAKKSEILTYIGFTTCRIGCKKSVGYLQIRFIKMWVIDFSEIVLYVNGYTCTRPEDGVFVAVLYFSMLFRNTTQLKYYQ